MADSIFVSSESLMFQYVESSIQLVYWENLARSATTKNMNTILEIHDVQNTLGNRCTNQNDIDLELWQARSWVLRIPVSQLNHPSAQGSPARLLVAGQAMSYRVST